MARAAGRQSPAFPVVILARAAFLSAAIAAGQETAPRIRVEGSRDIRQSTLLRLIDREFENAPAGQRWTVAADDAAFAIETLYRNRGYPFAQVAFESDVDDPAPTAATFIIEEGPRVFIRSVAFEGNMVFDGKGLGDIVTNTWSPLRDDRIPYVQANIRRAADEIVASYYERGYMAVSVATPSVSLDSAAGSADVIYTIQEGPEHRVDSVTIAGAPPGSQQALGRIVKPSEGKAYTPGTAARLCTAIEEHLASRGYPDVRVEPREEIESETGRVRVFIEIEPGDRVIVSGIDVVGNRRTVEGVIRARVTVEVGKPYDRREERRTFRLLYRMGLFRTVALDLEPDQGCERRLVVKVEEAPSREIFIEPGYGSYELFRVRLGLRNHNLFGRGKGFRAEGIAAVRAQKVSLSLTDPNLFATELLADYPVFWERREEPSFTRREYGLAPSVTWRISDTLSLTGVYRLKSSDASNVDVAEEVAGDETFRTSSTTLSPLFDARDSYFVPRRGMLVHPSIEWAAQGLGSELQFVRLRHRQSHFIPLTSRTVLALLLQTGVIVPQGETETIPIQERFFNGGENTVRSFLESELGPKDEGGDPLGGETFAAASAEIRQDLAGRWQIAAFVDAGNVLTSYEDYGSFDDIRYGVGLGLRYVLPIGPIRLDGAVNPDPREDEDDYAVHVSVGMAF